MSDLFGKYCYIDTPGIAGKKTRYRIIASRIKSNCWSEVPVKGKAEPVKHDHFEEIVIVVLDTLVSDDSTLLRFALKDIEVIEAEPTWIPCSERTPEENGRYLTTNSSWGFYEVDWNAWINGEWLYPNENPVAWMPMPEPYQEVEE